MGPLIENGLGWLRSHAPKDTFNCMPMEGPIAIASNFGDRKGLVILFQFQVTTLYIHIYI